MKPILESILLLIDEASAGAVAARYNRMSGKNKRIESLRSTQANVSSADVSALKRLALDKSLAQVEARRKQREKQRTGGLLTRLMNKPKKILQDKSGKTEFRDLIKYKLSNSRLPNRTVLA